MDQVSRAENEGGRRLQAGLDMAVRGGCGGEEHDREDGMDAWRTSNVQSA